MQRIRPNSLRNSLRGFCSAAVAVTALLSSGGCSQEEGITSYQVPKPHVLDESNPAKREADGSHHSAVRPPMMSRSQPVMEPSRMIAAMIEDEASTWFFKVIGPDKPVERSIEEFDALLNSIKFAESNPTWKTPESWEQLPDDAPQNRSGFIRRYATLVFNSEGESLELAVTSLGNPEGSRDRYLIDNINRWRDQLGLSGMEKLTYGKQVRSEVRKTTIDGKTAIIVNLAGGQRPGSSSPPFATSGRKQQTKPTSPDVNDPPSLTYTVPDGWTRAANDSFSKAAFAVENEGQALRITVSKFNASIPAMRDFAAQAARWRGQLQLEQITPQELMRSVQTIKTGSVSGDYVELIGPQDAPQPETILGVIAIEAGRVWVIKLKGDTELAAREKHNFESFVRSIRFSKSDGSR